jgi:hypothetical protein
VEYITRVQIEKLRKGTSDDNRIEEPEVLEKYWILHELATT